jgi:hypothetical protein
MDPIDVIDVEGFLNLFSDLGRLSPQNRDTEAENYAENADCYEKRITCALE